jgi:hypothetical protein
LPPAAAGSGTDPGHAEKKFRGFTLVKSDSSDTGKADPSLKNFFSAEETAQIPRRGYLR